jgi:biotin carboxyl carrier protein
MPARLHLTEDGDDILVEVAGRHVRFVRDGISVSVELREDGRLVAVDGPSAMEGSAISIGETVWVTIDGAVFEFHVGRTSQSRRTGEHDALTPPMPATVVRIAVRAGQSITRGDLLVALEAMKMELPVRAPRDAVVGAIHCREGELVQPGQILLDLVD